MNIFEWVFTPLRWISSHTKEFFELYINMGTLFWIIVIVLPILYAILVLQPYKRYLLWKEKGNEKLHFKEDMR